MANRPRVFVAGHKGLVGSAVVRRLLSDNDSDLLVADRRRLDLLDQSAVGSFFEKERPEFVVLAAAKVGGIMANSLQPAAFAYENLVIQCNVIHSAWRAGARKLVFLGSSCIYPKLAPQPMREDCLLSGPLEPTNEAYAIAKIAGLKLVEAYRKEHGFCCGISLMPTNLYGPGDNFDLETSHVLPALIRRFHEARLADLPQVVLWGTGTPRREFLHVDDLADAVCFALRNYDEPGLLNVGVGTDLAISELAVLISGTVGYKGNIVYDSSKPDGTPRKLLDVSRLTNLGWSAKIRLEDGVASTYAWYCEQAATDGTRHSMH